MEEVHGNVCPQCGATFSCGVVAGQASCWCAEFPVLRELPAPAAGCYCPACLRQLIEAQRVMEAP